MSRFLRVVGLVGSRVREFFCPLWRRVVAVVVVLGVGVGVGVWRFEVSQVEDLRSESSGIVVSVRWAWVSGSPDESDFDRYVVETERGVEFPGWRPKPQTVVELKKALSVYNEQVPVEKRVSYSHLVAVLGPDLRSTFERVDGDLSKDPVDGFFAWCNQNPRLVYADTPRNRALGIVGQSVSEATERVPTNYDYAVRGPDDALNEYAPAPKKVS